MKTFNSICGWIFFLIRTFLPIIIFIFLAVVVSFWMPCEFNYSENTFYYYNNHTAKLSDIIAMCTFLCGTILTFDIHYYDQIEPKYSNADTEADDSGVIEKQTVNKFLKKDKRYRLLTIYNIVEITILNICFIVTYFVNITWFGMFFTPEEGIMALFFTDWIYLIGISFTRQFIKWMNNLHNGQK